MRANHRHVSSCVAERGMSLVEILVGIAIGMIGVLIMYQTVSVWDARSRSSTSGSDAQVAGTLGMFALERDIRGAGLGFGTALPVDMGCTVNGQNAAAQAVSFPLRPVDIFNGDLTGVPDRISTVYGSSAFFVSTQYFSASPDAFHKRVVRRGGFKRGDLVVVAGNDTGHPGTSACQIIQVTDDTDPDGVTIAHANVTYPSFYSNPPGAPTRSSFNTAAGDGGVYSSGRLYNLGPPSGVHHMSWTVDPVAATLNFADDMQGNPATAVAEGVINMKAEFGVDSDSNGQITDAPNQWTKNPPGDWTQVRAIRVALLVRSRNFEKPAASAVDAAFAQASAPSWTHGTFVMTNVDGTPDTNPVGSPNNWRYYRYRVYEKVIPLRNLVWGTSP